MPFGKARQIRVRLNASGLGALLILCTACAHTPPRDAQPDMADIPAAWSIQQAGNAQTEALAQWWNRFRDPILTQLITRALQTNTSITSAQASLRQARALRDVSAAALWPSLDGSASAQRSRAGHQSGSNYYAAGLDASWELDVFGSNRHALDATRAEVLASAASLGDVQISIAAEVALNYISLRSYQARLSIANNNLASQQETLQITQWRMQAGLVTALETEQALTIAAQTRASIPPLQTSIAQSRHALAVLTGQPPNALATQLAAANPTPQADDDIALGIPAETLRQRPDVRTAEHLVAAARATLAQADAAQYPSFTLSGSLGFGSAKLSSLGDGASILNSLLAGVTVPLFNAGALRAQVNVQQAAVDIANANYRAAMLNALLDVEDALTALQGDREHRLLLQDAASSASNAAQLAGQRYGSGLVDFQTVLDTQRSVLSTQDSLASAEADVASDQVRLYKALGGGWVTDATRTVEASQHNITRMPSP